MTQEAIKPPDYKADPNLLEELDHLAYMQQEGLLPSQKKLKRIGQKIGMDLALEERLRTSLAKDQLKPDDLPPIVETVSLFSALGVKIPDEYRTIMPTLVEQCKQTMDLQGIPFGPVKRRMGRRRILQGMGAAGVVAAAGPVRFAYDMINFGRQPTKTYIKYDRQAIFTGSSPAEKYRDIAQAEPAPEPTPTSTPEPEPAPAENPQEVVGNANMAEFFLGDLLNLFKYRRQERVLFEPGAKERLLPALVSGDQITFLYLGLDETRERKIEFRGDGQGRSDVIMLISFNPHTFKTVAISIPRDMYTPRLGHSKINAMTSGIVRGDIMELSRTIVEELTGVPIDGIIQTNIDTIQGFNGIRNNNFGSEHPGLYYPGIFDVLAPEGIVINVPKAIVDNQYPVGYGTKRLVIPAGPQRMNGVQLTEYARTRHQEMDFGRSNNQRDILFGLLKVLASDAKDYLLSGNTGKLDLLISFLEREEQNGNVHYNETSFTQIVRTIREGLIKLSGDPQGKAILSTLALNSVDEVTSLISSPQAMFASFGLSFENGMLTNVAPGDTLLKLVSSSMNSSPIAYAQPLRRKIKELFGI